MIEEILVGALLTVVGLFLSYRWFPAKAAVALDTLDDILDDFNSKVERLEALALRKAAESQRATEEIARLERERAELDDEDVRIRKVKARLVDLMK